MKHSVLIGLFLKLGLYGFAQNPKQFVSKPPIDSVAIANWVSLGSNVAISNDGSYCAYNIKNQPVHSQTLVVQSLTKDWKKEFPFVDNGFFSQDNKQFCFQRKDTLYFLKLGTEDISIIPAVSSFSQPKNIQGKYIAYKPKTDKQELTILNILSGAKQRFDSVVDYLLSDNGNVLVLKKNTGQGNTTLDWVDLQSGMTSEVWHSNDPDFNVQSYTIDQSEAQLAFILQNKNGINGIWCYKTGMKKAVEKVSYKMIEEGLVLAGSSPKFSQDGNYIFFNLQKPEKPKPAKIEVSLDVWSYKDTLIQETQLFQRAPTYDAVISTHGGQVIQLTHDYERIEAWPTKGDSVVVSYNDEGDRFWLQQKPKNFLVSLKTGERKLLHTVLRSQFWFSPDGTYLVYYDFDKKGNYFSYNLSTGQSKNISNNVGEPLNMVDEFYKGQTIALAAGIVGWVENNGILVYDNYDVWKLDLTGKSNPINLTNGYGKKHQIKFRVIRSINNESVTTFGSSDTLLLSAFDVKSKYNGFFQMVINDSNSPEQLVMGPYTFFNPTTPINSHDFDIGTLPLKAADKNVSIVKRQSFNEAPNYFVTTDFKKFERLTDVNPQKEYNWLNAEMLTWKQFDGTTSQGILYKPENFDPHKKYPVIINYYQQLTHRFYQFPKPSFPSNNIDVPWFVSQGYLVFTPDIYFQSGRLNGQSAYNSIVSAAKYLQSFPFVDGSRIGINGHSTGGYYTNYLITQTKMFAAAVEGAGVSDNISSYLQLTGVLGKEQGARLNGTESSVGATLWGRPDLYLKSSPILKADKISTPLIIFHSKDDTAVPWEQGIEFYLALRRLNKPTWMLQYDGQGHGNAAGPYAIDYTIRITQFFDHYLKGAPAPQWMTHGIPASLKGVESRFELDPFGTCGTDEKPCPICDAWNKQYKRNPGMFEKPISEWKLDKDIEDEMNKKETERYNENMKGEAQRIKENNEKLNGTWKGEPY
jgi:dipeptidyl aminopeptidase/acylaminoacyl peptidase